MRYTNFRTLLLAGFTVAEGCDGGAPEGILATIGVGTKGLTMPVAEEPT